MMPHLLHATLNSEGFWSDVHLDCPYESWDPYKPCGMVDIYKDRAFVPGCAGGDWLDALGIEILVGPFPDPTFPLAVDVKWHSGGDHLTLEPHGGEA